MMTFASKIGLVCLHAETKKEMDLSQPIFEKFPQKFTKIRILDAVCVVLVKSVCAT